MVGLSSRTNTQNTQNEILSLFPNPLYTATRIYYREDLEEMGLGRSLDDVPLETGRVVLMHAKTLARIQPELAFHFLLKFPKLLRFIQLEDLTKWVSVVLDKYDSQGLNPARAFILELNDHPDFNRFWGEGIPLQKIHGVLSNYAHALGKTDITLEGGITHYTDTAVIYLPERIALFQDERLNFLLYKAMVTHKVAQLKLGTHRLNLKTISELTTTLKERYRQPEKTGLVSDLSRFLYLFPDPLLASDLFNLAETGRLEKWIEASLPGLFGELKGLKPRLGLGREAMREIPPRTQIMEGLIHWWLTGKVLRPMDSTWTVIMKKVVENFKEAHIPERSVEDVAVQVAAAYRHMDSVPGPYRAVKPIPYVGELKPEEAERGRMRRRESTRLKFREELAKFVGDLPECEEVVIEADHSMHRSGQEKRLGTQLVPKQLLIDGNPVPLSDAMQKIIEDIYEDLGSIPAPYLAITDDMSGHYFRSLCRIPQGTSNVLPSHGEGIHVLDEWDYRRQGYRKGWVFLRETDASSGGLAFAEDTLNRHRGMIQVIKRQFERIRLEQILLRRQKDGDNVDLDAAVEAFSDRHAGLSPSERVFVRLRREKRDIATVFLIDLSGSTKGWINEMERAALLILSESMQVLQDRFAVYGFSGRTRKRCELLRIKGFDEPYGEAVKRRMANLRAMEYTRMGPPIRHITALLNGIEARTRLLITLSDGKPDDYDGYKGDYGIEDTRQALLEAKRAGVHPFCITIDRAEHSYLSHMYGAVNYVFIDDLSKLPKRVPEIYRKLTT